MLNRCKCGHNHHLAAPFLDNVTANHIIWLIIAAFDDKIRLQKRDQILWGVFVKDRDRINHIEGGEGGGPLIR